MFGWVENRLLDKDWNIEFTLVPSLQIKPKKYSARKCVWHCFWKGERSWWDSKQNEGLWWSSRRKGFLKKELWENSQNSQENTCAICPICALFWYFLVNSAEFVRTPFFSEQNQTTASDYSNINSININLGQMRKLLKGQTRWRNRF